MTECSAGLAVDILILDTHNCTGPGKLSTKKLLRVSPIFGLRKRVPYFNGFPTHDLHLPHLDSERGC